MFRKIIERWQRLRVLRALRILAVCPLVREKDITILFTVENRGVLVRSGETSTLQTLI